MERYWDGKKWVFTKDLGPIEQLDAGVLVQKLSNEYIVKGIANDVEVPRILVIPESHKGIPIVEIGANAFAQNKHLVQVELPKTIRRISSRAFKESSIQKVNFPEGLREIGVEAFYGSQLQAALLPSYLEELGEYAFQNSALKTIRFPKRLKKLGNHSILAGCSFDNAKIVFAEEEETLDGVFEYVSGIDEIYLPSVTYVKGSDLDSAWNGPLNNRLKVFFQQKKVRFSGSAFTEYISDLQIAISKSLTEDEHNRKVNSLSKEYLDTIIELHFPRGAELQLDEQDLFKTKRQFELHVEGEPVRHWDRNEKTWKSGAVALDLWETKVLDDGTLSIVKCKIPKTAKQIVVPSMIDGRRVSTLATHLFDGFKEVTSITLPETITRIENACFIRMKKLEEIMLPSSLKMDESDVGAWMFQWCTSLKKVVFLSAPKYFPWAIFSHCPALEKIEMPGTTLPQIVGRYTFEDVPASFRLELKGNGLRYCYVLNNKEYTFDVPLPKRRNTKWSIF